VQVNFSQEAAILTIQPVAGYAAVSIGSKIIFYQYDETANILRPIVEYDAKMLNTCLASMRGFMMCGDYLGGISFIRFKEEEREESKRRFMDLMAEDNTLGCITAIEFWIDQSHGSLAIIGAIAANTKGFIQILSYVLESIVYLLIIERNLELVAEIYLGETVCKFIKVEFGQPNSETKRDCVLYCSFPITYRHL
jgi:hypothetical protein